VQSATIKKGTRRSPSRVSDCELQLVRDAEAELATADVVDGEVVEEVALKPGSYDWLRQVHLLEESFDLRVGAQPCATKAAVRPGLSATFLYDFSIYDIRGRQFRLGVSYKL